MAEKVELDIDVARLREEVRGLQADLLKLGQTGGATYTTLSSDIEEATAAMKDMEAVQKEVNDDLKKSETSISGLGAKIRNHIKDTQIAGKSVGEWKDQLSGAFSGLIKTAQGSGALSGALRIMGTAVKATGIGLLITAVGGAIAYFTRFQSGIDTVSRVLESASAVVNVMVDRVVKLASAIGSFLSGDFSGAAASLEASFSGIATELVNAATAAYDLEKRVQNLRDATRTANVENARLSAQLEGLRRIADDDTQSIQKRNAARQSAAKIEQQLANDGIDKALEAQQIAAGKFALDRENATKRDALAQAEIDLQGAIAEKNRAIFENEKQGRELQIKQREKSAKALKDESDALEKLRKDLEKLRVETQPEGIDQELAAVEKKFNDLQKLTIDGVAKLNEIEKRRGLTSKEQAERQEFVDLAQKLEERRLEALSDVLVKFADKDIEIEAAQAKAKEDIRKKDFEAAKKSIENVKKLQDSEIDITEENFKNFISILEANGTDKAKIEEAQFNFDNIIKEKRLQTEIEFQEGLLALIGDGDANQTELIKNQIAKLRAQLDGLSIGPAARSDKKKNFNFFSDILGLDPEDPDFDKKKKAIISAFSEITRGLQGLAQARVDEAQAQIEAADNQIRAAEKRVSSAQDALATEIKIAQLGFANNVDARNKELAAAEAQEAAAKTQRDKALQDKKKAQRAQIIQDSILQGSNIITSATEIYKAFAVIPFVGPFLGAAAVAFLIGSFVGAKSKALAATKVQAKEGITGRITETGIAVGPSHDNGGIPLEIEGNEFVYQDGKRISVVKKSATKTHFDLLQAINRDDRPSMLRYVEKLTGGISRNTETGTSSSGSVGISDKETHKLLAENNRLQKKMIQMEEDKVEYIDMGTYVLAKSKNREIKLKKG